MTHVHARLSALVDGEVDNDSRERILAHLTHCEECRLAAEEERRIKALLSGMPSPPPSDDLTAFLVGLGTGDPIDEMSGGRTDDAAAAPAGWAHGLTRAGLRRRGTSVRIPVGAGGPASAPRPPSRSGSPGPRRPPLARRAREGLPRQLPRTLQSFQRPIRRTSRSLGGGQLGGQLGGHFGRRTVVGVAGLAAMAGMAVVAAFAAGGSPAGAQVTVVPPVQQYSVEHADTVSDLPLSDPGAVTAVLEQGRGARTTGR